MIVRLPNGEKARFPDNLPVEQVQSILQKQFGTPKPKPNLFDRGKEAFQKADIAVGKAMETPLGAPFGAAEAAGSTLTGMAAFPISGLAQAITLAYEKAQGTPTDEALTKAQEAGDKVASYLVYQPKSAYGKAYNEIIGKVIGIPSKVARAYGEALVSGEHLAGTAESPFTPQGKISPGMATAVTTPLEFSIYAAAFGAIERGKGGKTAWKKVTQEDLKHAEYLNQLREPKEPIPSKLIKRKPEIGRKAPRPTPLKTTPIEKTIPKPEGEFLEPPGMLTAEQLAEQAGKELLAEEPLRVANIDYFHGGPPVEQLGQAIKDSAAGKKLIDLIDVEAKYKRIGKPETGFAMKNIFSKRAMIEEQGIEDVRTVAKLAKYDKKVLQEAPLFTESIERTKSAPPDVKPLAEWGVKYFEDARKEYAARGVPVNYKNRIISDIHDLISKAEESEIPALEETLKAAEDLQFVHIPSALWFESQLGDPVGRTQLLRILATQKRKTFNIKSLIDSGAIKPEQINMADIIASYARRKARDFALLDLVDAARKEGLIYESPHEGYSKLPAYRAPMLAKYHIHPWFAEQLLDLTKVRERMNVWERGMVTAKMSAFYNPLFLPMYDLVQQAMAMQMGFVKAPKYWLKAAKDVWKKTPQYWEALDNGLASKPFNNPWDSYMDWANAVQNTIPMRMYELTKSQATRVVKQKGIFKKLPVLPDIYNTSWHIAWELDKTVRMATYNFLRDKGMSPRDAAQTAAKFHSDYASVPARTRKVLNHVFFTPTFKITMGKLYGRMIADAIKSVRDPRKMIVQMERQADGSFAKKKFTLSKQGRYALGLAAVIAINQAADMFFKGLGFRQDEWGRRYVKTVETEEGTKELVVTYSNPANMFAKYIYRGMAAIKSDNPITTFFATNRWEVHPTWRVAYDIATGKTPKGEIIYDWKLDGPMESGKKATWYATKEILAVLSAFDPNKTDEEGRKLFAREVSRTLELATRPFTFKYVRGTERRRIAYKMKAFAEHLREFMFIKLRHKEKWTPENIENFRKEMKRLREELNESKQK